MAQPDSTHIESLRRLEHVYLCCHAKRAMSTFNGTQKKKLLLLWSQKKKTCSRRRDSMTMWKLISYANNVKSWKFLHTRRAGPIAHDKRWRIQFWCENETIFREPVESIAEPIDRKLFFFEVSLSFKIAHCSLTSACKFGSHFSRKRVVVMGRRIIEFFFRRSSV